MKTQIHFNQNKIESSLSISDFPENKEDKQENMNTDSIKKIMDEMPGGFFIYYAEGKKEIIFANKAMLRIFNCNTMEEFREITNNSFLGIVHPDDLEQVELSIKEQIQQSQYDLDYVEYRIIQKGGAIRWIEDYGHFIHDENFGNIFYVFVADVTEKKERFIQEQAALLKEKVLKEQKLKSEIEKYSKELEVIHHEHLRRLEMIEGLSIDYESIFYVNLDSNYIKPYRLNSQIQELFPISSQLNNFTEYNTAYQDAYVYFEDKELVAKATTKEFIQQKLSHNQSFYINYRINTQTQIEYQQLRIVNIGNQEHTSQFIMGYRNIDNEMKQELEQKKILENTLKRAKAANTAKDTFLSNMSHDMRTPMNAVLGFTTLARKYTENPEKLNNYLDKIEAAGKQLLHLINDVLEISQLESGKIHLEETECNLIDILQDVQSIILPKAAAKHITFSLDSSSLQHYYVYCDEQKLKQIILCLASNSIKYTKPGGHITITTAELKVSSNHYASYQFIVEDTGIGISKDFLKHIFQPFERHQNTTLSGIEGTGLGLTITKSLLEIMGGTIDVFSEIGRGSKFIVSLNFRLQNISSTFPMQDKPDKIPFPNHQKILLVEDNEINLEIETELLQDIGFVVDTAANGKIAVEKVKNSHPGEYFLILMDIQMPIMDGHQASKSIREIENPDLANIPIIALSANAFEEDKIKSMKSGMNAHMAKPIDLPKLLDLMKTVIHLI